MPLTIFLTLRDALIARSLDAQMRRDKARTAKAAAAWSAKLAKMDAALRWLDTQQHSTNWVTGNLSQEVTRG